MLALSPSRTHVSPWVPTVRSSRRRLVVSHSRLHLRAPGHSSNSTDAVVLDEAALGDSAGVKVLQGGRYTATYLRDDTRRSDLHLDLAVALDISQSMDHLADNNKTRLQIVSDCLEAILRSSLLRPTDRLTIFTFTEEVTKDYSGTVGAFPGLLSGRSGWTAARDAVYSATMEVLNSPRPRPIRPVLKYVLAFTDGADNRSSISVPDLTERVAASGYNLYLVVISAGMDATDRKDWHSICHRPGDKLIAVDSATALDIRSAFDQATEHLRHLIVQSSSGFSELITVAGTESNLRQLDKTLESNPGHVDELLKKASKDGRVVL